MSRSPHPVIQCAKIKRCDKKEFRIETGAKKAKYSRARTRTCTAQCMMSHAMSNWNNDYWIWLQIGKWLSSTIARLQSHICVLSLPLSLSLSRSVGVFLTDTCTLTLAGLMNMNSSHFIFFSIGVRMFDFFFSFKLYIFRTLSRILSFSTAHILRWLVFVMARSDRSFDCR